MEFKKIQIKCYAIVLFAFLLFSVNANAFIFIQAGGYAKGSRPVANAPVYATKSVTFYINSSQTVYGGAIAPDISESDFIYAVTEAVNAWKANCDTDISISYGGTTSTTKNSSDGNFVISWDNRTTGTNYISNTSVLAAAFSAVSGDEIVDCDIIVNGEFSGTFTTNPTSGNYDIISTLTHEVGHCLGLDHPIEPPTYTSTNSFLTTSTMVQTAVAGGTSTFRRTPNQDDLDGMECMYPDGGSLRSGRCTSYHGTNGGAAITGDQTGGATEDLDSACGTESDAVTVSSSGVTGSGCITSALASGKPTHELWSDHFLSWFLGWFILMLVYFLVLGTTQVQKSTKKLMRGFGRLFLVIVGIGFLTSTAHAGQSFFEFGGEYHKISSKQLNEFVELDNNFSEDTKNLINHSLDLVAAVGHSGATSSATGLQWFIGLYGRYIYPKRFIQKGTGNLDGVAVSKTTILKGYSGGPFLRAYIENTHSFALFAEMGAGFGKIIFDQEVIGSSTSSLEASAMALEGFAHIGAGMNIWGDLKAQLKVGYHRQKSVFVTVDQTDGSLYSSLSPGERLVLGSGADAQEFQAERIGIVVNLSLSMMF